MRAGNKSNVGHMVIVSCGCVYNNGEKKTERPK